MRILILGGDGMLGHTLFGYLKGRHDVAVTLRQDYKAYSSIELFSKENSFCGVDASSLGILTRVFAAFHPEAIVNCIGIVKQRSEASEAIPSLEINALLPHRLAVLCKAIGARLIHLSTDCVFSGNKGNYSETDASDGQDLYGRTKFLGEVRNENHCLTLRTSMIGFELSRKTGLLEWFLAQKGAIKGFKKAIFSGFTTLELSRIIEDILVNHLGAAGIYHVSSEPISKFDLLSLVKEKFGLQIEIMPDNTVNCDRSLDSKRFREDFGYTPPSWEHMIEELRKDSAGDE